MLGDQRACPAGVAAVAGQGGWMADFGEYLPFDAVLASGESAAAVHNRYPELWSEVNAAALAEAGRRGSGADDAAFFTRSGFRAAPGSASLAWHGDQLVTWDGYDGMRSALTCALSGGHSGYALSHSDTGGYTMLQLRNVSVRGAFVNATTGTLEVLRSKELLLRWMELSAFADALYRTHPGNLPGLSAQWDSDANTTAHFARFARVFVALGPYRRELMADAAAKGWPLVRSLWMAYAGEDDETSDQQADARARAVQDQFALGDELLVAPVMAQGASARKVFFPALRAAEGRWVSVWTRAPVPGTGTKATEVEAWPAPMGQPPVFFKEFSQAKGITGGDLAKAIVAAAAAAGGNHTDHNGTAATS